MHHRTAGDRTQLAQASRSRRLHLPPCCENTTFGPCMAARTATQHRSLQATPRLMVARSCCPTRHLPCFPQVHPCPPPPLRASNLPKGTWQLCHAMPLLYNTHAGVQLRRRLRCNWQRHVIKLVGQALYWHMAACPCGPNHHVPGPTRGLSGCCSSHAGRAMHRNATGPTSRQGRPCMFPAPFLPPSCGGSFTACHHSFTPSPYSRYPAGTSSPPAAASCRHQIKCTASVPAAAAATGCHGSRLGAAAAKPVCRRTLLPPPGAPAAARHNG